MLSDGERYKELKRNPILRKRTIIMQSLHQCDSEETVFIPRQ
jgi:hypothetical protein